MPLDVGPLPDWAPLRQVIGWPGVRQVGGTVDVCRKTPTAPRHAPPVA
jgi:hypothetical protein